MKIIVITHAGGSKKYGPNMRWYNLGQELKLHNINLTIVASSFFHKYIKFPKVKTNKSIEEIDNIKYIWIKTRPYKKRGISQILNQFEFTLKIICFIKQIRKEKPNFIIASSPHPFVIFPAYLLAKTCSSKLIYEARDLWPIVLYQLKVLKKFNPYYWILKYTEIFSIKIADLIIYLKEGESAYYKEFFKVKEKKLLHIPNSHYQDNLPIRAFRKSYDLKKICYAGALSKYYNIYSIIELAKKCQDNNQNQIKFIIVGKGELEQNMKLKIKELNLGNIIFKGALDKTNTQKIIKSSDITFISLRNIELHKYGISCNKIYEYMFFKKPILGYYKCNYDPIKNAKCGLVSEPGDINKLYNDLIFLIENKNQAELMGINGYEHYLKFYNTKKNASCLINKLKKLTKSN